MMTDGKGSLEQSLKEKLLEGLIEHMSGKMGEDLGAKFPHKAMEVSVAAPNKEKLSEGLDQAKELADKDPEDEGDDEDRLMALLGDDDDEDEDKKGA